MFCLLFFPQYIIHAVYVDSNIHLCTYDMSEYISKSTIIKYRDNGLTEKSIQILRQEKNKSTENCEDAWPSVRQ